MSTLLVYVIITVTKCICHRWNSYNIYVYLTCLLCQPHIYPFKVLFFLQTSAECTGTICSFSVWILICSNMQVKLVGDIFGTWRTWNKIKYGRGVPPCQKHLVHEICHCLKNVEVRGLNGVPMQSMLGWSHCREWDGCGASGLHERWEGPYFILETWREETSGGSSIRAAALMDELLLVETTWET